ncbi:MAG: hypothetical protein ABR588_00630 [Sphingomicrobium sp.]|nr:hypothetical protein [Sphingomonadales bacterium]
MSAITKAEGVMGPGLFVIAILGCTDGSADCRPLATLPTRYENRATCAAATAPALLASTGYDFPELQAECRLVASPASSRNDQRRSVADRG